MGEYYSRRGFLTRLALGGAVALGGTVDGNYTLSKLAQLREEAKNEVIEQGVTPPSPVCEIQKQEAKAQQERFDKAVLERFHGKNETGNNNLRIIGDSVALFGGLVVVFDAMYDAL